MLKINTLHTLEIYKKTESFKSLETSRQIIFTHKKNGTLLGPNISK